MRLIERSMPGGDRVRQGVKTTLAPEPSEDRLTEPDARQRAGVTLAAQSSAGLA